MNRRLTAMSGLMLAASAVFCASRADAANDALMDLLKVLKEQGTIKDEKDAVGPQGGGRELVPTGKYITPTAAPGSTYQQMTTELRPDGNADANGAYTSVLSPDGHTLLVLTNGFNSGFMTTEGEPIRFPYLDPITGQPSAVTSSWYPWIFVYDVSSVEPKKIQQINIPSAYAGIAWDPSGQRFYVSGGQEDRIHIYKRGEGGWVTDAPFVLLNHNSDAHKPKTTYDGGIYKDTPAGQSINGRLLGINFGAMTAGVAASADGSQLYAVNMQNDSVSIIEASTRQVTKEIRLFIPGTTDPRGAYPMWVTPAALDDGTPAKAYVTSVRDGEVIVIDLKSGEQKIIELGGAPTKMVLSPNRRSLFVVNPDLDEVDEIDTVQDALKRRISLLRPGYRYRGSNPNSLALSRDGATLYVTLGGENAVAVVDVHEGEVRGRIPTTWYPTSVTLSHDERRLYVVNFKSNTGANTDGGKFVVPNTEYAKSTNPTFQNQYNEALQKSGLLTIPIPNDDELFVLSQIVDHNNNFVGDQTDQSEMMKFLQDKIKHVIYIMKENRSYDQMLGDLPVGNGDPRLTYFPRPVTPNLHALAEDFVVLDNFYVASESSGSGWQWVTQGHANEYAEVIHQLNEGSGFLGTDFLALLGTPRSLNLAMPLEAENPSITNVRITTLLDPTGASTVLPGPKGLVSTWGADNHDPEEIGGYLWDAVLRKGKRVRHYGLWTDTVGYYQFNGDFSNTFWTTPTPNAPDQIPIARDAAARKIEQAAPIAPGLVGLTDPYYRGWDLNVPDEYRYEEWKREFDEYVKNGNLPNFIPMLLMMDHTGNFASNVAGLNTPELQLASNDHAVGLLVDAVSHSPYWQNTVIFIVEDDSLDGPDHVDAHRSPAYVISPYTKRKTVVSTFYNHASVVRTICDILDLEHLSLNDANTPAMDEVFTKEPDFTPYDHFIPGNLLQPPVDPTLVTAEERNDPRIKKTKVAASLHDGKWWAMRTASLDFSHPDALDPNVYNRILWKGIVGDSLPYPEERHGADLRRDREALLEQWKSTASTTSSDR